MNGPVLCTATELIWLECETRDLGEVYGRGGRDSFSDQPAGYCPRTGQ